MSFKHELLQKLQGLRVKLLRKIKAFKIYLFIYLPMCLIK